VTTVTSAGDWPHGGGRVPRPTMRPLPRIEEADGLRLVNSSAQPADTEDLPIDPHPDHVSSRPPLPLITVRNLGHSDLPDVVRIDAEASGRRRAEYFELMLMRALNFAGLQMSLVAELDGRIVGYVIASLFYGEYGISEPTASIDAIAVAAAARRSGVARAMMEQFRANAAAIGVSVIRTEVPWDDFDLLAFFKSEGFVPAQRVCLERPASSRA
jgi:ribosomal protein S18 acetylase RimI-like enzyme